MSNTPFYTKTETDYKVQDAKSQAYLGIATTTTTPPATGAVWYRADTEGTYTNFLSGGSPIVVTEAELDANDVFFDVANGVATKYVKTRTDSRDKMFRDSQYVSNGSVILNSLGQITSMSVKWSDGVIGNLTNSNYNDFVMEYEKTTVTYNTITVVYDSTFDANGNTINKNITIS